MDLSKLSDEELTALYARQTQAQRNVQGMSDDELRAAAYVQPAPPAGAVMHDANGSFRREGNKWVPTTQALEQARAVRQQNGVAGDVADAVLRGVPYAGAFFPRARAGMQSALNGTPYADNLTAEQARASTFDQDYPGTSFGAKTAGAIGGTVAALPLTRGAGVLPTMARIALGGGAGSLPGAMGRGAIAGGLQGATQAVGESADVKGANVPSEALRQGAFGAALGAVIPTTAAGLGYIWDKARSVGTDALSSVPSEARAWLIKQLGDPAKIQQQRQAVQALGPEGMLADVAPEWKGIAQGGSSKPGSRDAIVKALSARDEGKNARMRATIDSEIGPDVVPSQVRAQIKAAKEALSPEYEAAFANSKAVDTKAVADKLETLAIDKRGAAASAADDVRKMLNIKGTDQLDPNPRTLHQVRMAIDGMLDGTTDGNVRRVLGEARKAIDDELAAKVPGIKAVDTKYAAIQREADAYKTGQTVFDSGRDTVLRPSELAAKQAELVQPSGTAPGPPTDAALRRLSDGARSEIERIVGTNSNDVSRLNTLLKGEGDWNRDKLRLLFGKDKADRILNVIDAERKMEGTFREVVGGSQTGVKEGFRDFLNQTGKPTEIPPDVTLTGLALRGGRGVVRALTGSRAEEQAARAAEALGPLSVAQGADRDALIAALMTRAQRSAQMQQIYDMAGRTGPASRRIIDALMNDADARERRQAKR